MPAEVFVKSLIAINDLDRASELIAERLREEHNDDIIEDLNGCMGTVCLKRGDYSSALEFYQKSLNMRLKIYSDLRQVAIAESYNNIGNVYRSQGDYSSALDCHQKSLNMRLKIYSDSPHPDIAMSYNNIGTVYQSQGDYSSALARLKKGLAALPPGQSPHRTKISRKIQETERIITELVNHMVRAPRLFTIQSQSHSPIMNHRLGLQH